MSYPDAAWERAMTVQEVMLKALGVWAQTPPQQRVISGGDLGFRVEGQARDGTPTGKLVVRMNGQWVEVGFAVGIAKAARNSKWSRLLRQKFEHP